MKRYLYLILCFGICYICDAKDLIKNDRNINTIASSDSTVSTLDEVVVEGRNQFTSATKSVYIPTSKEKDSSYDITSLLQRMGIPELSVSPFDGIKTVSGKDVNIYINYLLATGMDLEAINTKDVLSVEYLDFPSDPRFHGDDYVVNIIMRQYKYGGYTKIWNRSDWTSKVITSSSLFQRINYKKMSYDIFTNYSYSDLTHIGRSSVEHYNIPISDGTVKSLIRKQEFIDSKNISTTVPITLRIKFQSEKVTIRNTFGYNFNHNPLSRNHGQLTVSTLPDDINQYNSYSKSKSNSLSWNGEFNFDLPYKWYLSMTNLFGYSYNKNHSSYLSGYQNTTFENSSREKAYSYSGDIDLQKILSGGHSVSLGLGGRIIYNHVDYIGTTQMTEHYAAPNLSGTISYNYNSRNMYIGTMGGISWEGRRVNGVKHYSTYPFFNINANYAYNLRNRSSLSLQYTKVYTNAATMAPVTIQTNEFLYLKGNPDLKSYPIIMASLSHTFLPKDFFSLSCYLSYTGFYNRISEAYFPMSADKCAIIKTYVQGGDYQNVSLGANLGFKKRNKFSFTVKPAFSLYHKTGIYRHDYYPFSIISSGSLYLNNFYISYYLESPKKIVYTDEDIYEKGVFQHEFHFGYSKSGMHLSLSFCNPFRKSYEYRNSKLETPYYTSFSNSFSPQNNRCIVFTVLYTINYGKKTDKDNEAKAMKGASSVVLQ